MKKLNVLELFSGSRCIGSEAERQGHNVCSVDWTDYPNTDLVMDIGKIQMRDLPFFPDMIWASPDCTTYSIAACSTHRTNTKEPKSEYAIKCDTVNQHWIGMMKALLEMNPTMVFFIENPRGMLRHMDWMQEFTRHTIWYCQYGDERAKPTDIWTNSRTWIPKKVCRNYKYDSEGKIINKHCHHSSARRGDKTGTQGRSNSFERSKIPKQLCQDIIKSL